LLNIILACNGNDEGNDNLSNMCDDDELDDLENGPAPRMLNDSDESCMFCWEFGRDGSDVASVQIGYMLNVARLKRQIILCMTFA
jgi:hypothetical protein